MDSVFIALNVIGWTLGALTVGAVLARRHVFPINGRSMPLLVAFVILVATQQTMGILPNIGWDFQCYTVVDLVVGGLNIYIATGRFFRLFAILKVSQLRSQIREDAGTTESPSPEPENIALEVVSPQQEPKGDQSQSESSQKDLRDALSKWSKMAQDAFVWRGIIAAWAVNAVIIIPVVLAFESCNPAQLEDPSDPTVLLATANGIIAGVFIVVLAFKTRKFPADEFLLGRELKYAGVCALGLMVVTAVFADTGNTAAIDVIIWLFFQLISLTVLVFPVGLSFGYRFSILEPYNWCRRTTSPEEMKDPASSLKAQQIDEFQEETDTNAQEGAEIEESNST